MTDEELKEGPPPQSVVLLFSRRSQIRNILSAALTQRGFQVLLTDTPYLTSIKASQFLPDLIIAEISAEHTDDFEIASRLQKSLRTNNIPLLLMAPPKICTLIDEMKAKHSSGEVDSTIEHIRVMAYSFKFVDMLKEIEAIIPGSSSVSDFPGTPEGRQKEAFREKLLDPKITPREKLDCVQSSLKQQWAFPFTVVRAMKIIGSESSCCKELGKCVGTDLAATSAILRVANTVCFGKRGGRVSNTVEAVVRLGFNETRKLLACLAMIDLSKDIHGKYGFTRNGFWMHSLATAIAAEKLCANCGYPQPEIAFLSGLIHDIGKIPIDNMFNTIFLQLLEESVNRGTPFHRTESQLLKFTHSDLGHYLSTNWNFPSSIALSILHHHKPQQILNTKLPIDRILQGSVFTGNIFAKAMQIGRSCDEIIGEIPGKILSDLSIPNGPKSYFFSGIMRSLKQFHEYLGIPLDSSFATPAVIDERPITIVYGSEIHSHPIVLALKRQGYQTELVSNYNEEKNGDPGVVIFIPNTGVPLDITLSGEDGEETICGNVLKIYLVDRPEPKKTEKELAKINIMLVNRWLIDLHRVFYAINKHLEKFPAEKNAE